MRHSHPSARESGQAAVESALVIPMMVFLVLGIIQLSMMQHARLMTEYAAYRAVRTGIVDSGSCDLMKKSAVIAILPTVGPIVGIKGRTDSVVNFVKLNDAFHLTAANTTKYLGILPVLKVEVLNPKKSQLSNLFNTYGVYGATSGKKHTDEIDWDDVRDATVIAGNLLTVRVKYYYEMRIPFANRLMHSWYIGYEYLSYLRGVQFENQQLLGVNGNTALELKGLSKGGDYSKMATLAGLKKYVVPLVATYSMRMQSNLMKNQVSSCAVDG